ncbi:MAG: DUF4349 domain-containing protein [Actinomycetota bacterium]|nr:DUF4349 domain-containing protein [Actinomycetota bacterium]
MAAVVVPVILVALIAASCGRQAARESVAPERAVPEASPPRNASPEMKPGASSAAATLSRDASGDAGEGGDGDAAERGGDAGARSIAAPAALPEPAPAPELPPLPNVPPAPNRIIKNASVEVEISKGSFRRQFARASAVAEQFGGFVSNSSVTESEGNLSAGTLTIRVPSNQFQAALERFKSLGKVTNEQQSGQDVTKEFVDLESRLRQARAQEAFYLRLIDQARTISDMIQIQSQLAAVQLRIEEIEGQLQFLRDQTSFSTITARIYEPGAPLEDRPRPLGQAWEDALGAFQKVVSGAVVGLGWIAPFALLALMGYGVYRGVRRTRTRRAGGATTPAA